MRYESEFLSLFPARGLRDLLVALFARDAFGTTSALGRECGLTPRAASQQLARLRKAHLVDCEGVGASYVYRRARNPRSDKLAALIRDFGDAQDVMEPRLEESLAFYGAPLLRASPRRTLPLEAALALAAKRSRDDSTLFRALPVLVARNADRFDWNRLREEALRTNARAEVGLLLELTGVVSPNRDLVEHAKGFRDRRRSRMEPFFPFRNKFEEKLAKAKTPAVALRWKFWMNMDLETLRSPVTRRASAS